MKSIEAKRDLKDSAGEEKKEEKKEIAAKEEDIDGDKCFLKKIKPNFFPELLVIDHIYAFHK